MLRALVVLLLLANLGVWVWQSGWMAAGETPPVRTEVEPGRVRIMAARLSAAAPALPTTGPASAAPNDSTSAPVAGAASTPAPVATAAGITTGSTTDVVEARRCLEAGPFPVAELAALKTALAPLPGKLVALQGVTVKGTWLIYMGPFADADALDRKRAELRRMRDLSFDEAKGPASLVPGLVLGRFNQEASARTALENMRQRGIRTARVVVLKPPQELTVARAAQASPSQALQLQSLDLPAGRSFKPCEG